METTGSDADPGHPCIFCLDTEYLTEYSITNFQLK